MKNNERQKSLDKKKWIESEKNDFDMSGFMPYCQVCKERDCIDGGCIATQEEREGQCLCATAYNRMKRAEK